MFMLVLFVAVITDLLYSLINTFLFQQ